MQIGNSTNIKNMQIKQLIMAIHAHGYEKLESSSAVQLIIHVQAALARVITYQRQYTSPL